MASRDLCPKCGTPIAQSIKGSFETFVAGYVVCWKCRTRIDLETGGPDKPPAVAGRPHGPAEE